MTRALLALSVSRCLISELGDGLQIETSNDPQGAKQRLQAGECDLLISDFEMPGADGIEMLRFAKSYNAWTQVVLMTAHSTWDRVNKAIELGASDYLLKPLRGGSLSCRGSGSRTRGPLAGGSGG